LALAVPLSRFTSRVGGGSAFFVRHQADADVLAMDLSRDFWQLGSWRRCDGRFESFRFESVAGSFERKKKLAPASSGERCECRRLAFL